jgi:hypothetical protein
VEGAARDRRTGILLVLPLYADDRAGQLAKVFLLGLRRAALVNLTPARRATS